MEEAWSIAAGQSILPQPFLLPTGNPLSVNHHSRRLCPGRPTAEAAGTSQRPFYFLPRSRSTRTVLHGWHKVAFMYSDVYDPDDALNRSPGLRPSIIKYGPDDSIPPFLQDKQQRAFVDGKRDSSSSPTSSEGRSSKHRRRHRKPQSSLGDAVLIGILDPNRPDIARQAGEVPLTVDSESEDDRRTRTILAPSKPSVTHASVFAKNALDLIPDDQTRTTTTSLPSFKELVSQEPVFSPKQFPPSQKAKVPGRLRQDSLAASNVGKYTIPPPSTNPEILPAIQAPATSIAVSPENSQNLPSIRSALADLDSAPSTKFPMQPPTPQLSRGPSALSTGPTPDSSFAPAQMPTPYSHPSPMSLKEMSTTSPPSQAHYIMQPPSLTPDTSNMTSFSEASLYGGPLGKSPAHSYPTPTELRSAIEERPDGMLTGTTIYKCPYPGCLAAPFQTQYLLNSHANVHSQDRPHFCPVTNCPRGIGGKGFKRKNEMIRHGLVHDSPGYVCPFCIDQQHKYPRPDNLQRHVRVHHIDKDKDDPELRIVLSQRPKGSGRGRRRRGHS